MNQKQTQLTSPQLQSGTTILSLWRFAYPPATMPTIYLAVIAAAEYLTAAVDLRLGLVLHVLTLLALLWHGAGAANEAGRALYWGLTLAPLIRILSLSLPLSHFPTLYWYAVVSIPLFVATVVAARSLGYSRQDLGLTLRLRVLPLDVLLVPVGLTLGAVEYLILRPDSVVRNLTLAEAWLPVFILTVSAGLGEELIFRGLLQRAALQLLGTWGLVYVSGLFAILQIGYLSAPHMVLVFGAGLLFASVAWRTRSIVGVTMAHASVNVSLFLLSPFFLALWSGG